MNETVTLWRYADEKEWQKDALYSDLDAFMQSIRHFGKALKNRTGERVIEVAEAIDLAPKIRVSAQYLLEQAEKAIDSKQRQKMVFNDKPVYSFYPIMKKGAQKSLNVVLDRWASASIRTDNFVIRSSHFHLFVKHGKLIGSTEAYYIGHKLAEKALAKARKRAEKDKPILSQNK
jgi:hypothetical protein